MKQEVYLCEKCGKAEAYLNAAYCDPCEAKWDWDYAIKDIKGRIEFYSKQYGFSKQEILDRLKGEQK